VRLWVNGELIIDDWNPHPPEEHQGTTTVPLVAGRQYTITLAYFEDLSTAEVQLEWESTHQAREIVPTSQLYLPGEGTGTGLFGAYYSDATLSTLVLSRTDSLIDFDWMGGSPDTLLPDDGFSVRWRGMVEPRYTEPYTFTVSASDGTRLWVNGELLIDDWTTHGNAAHSGVTSVALTAGQTYTITLEYFEDTEGAEVHLYWASPRQAEEGIPTRQLYPLDVSLAAPLPLTNTRVLTYTYDGLQRLTETQEVGPTATTAYSSTYDLAGNRLEAWTNGVLIQNHSYDDANQVSGWSYDAAGNLTSDGTTTNTWDALNRLTVQGTTSNAYNGDGVLVAQTTGSTTITYTQDLIAPLSQILSDGTSQYVYGADRLFGGASSARTWYLGDALGSVRQTFDDAGFVQQALRYDAWGVPQGSSIAPFGYTGELQQGNQVYLRARWYNAGNGAFGSRDPWSGNAKSPQSLSYYAYVSNNPLIFSDPTGKWRFQRDLYTGPSGIDHDPVLEHYSNIMWGSPFLATFGHVEYTIGNDSPWPCDLQELFAETFPGKGGIYLHWNAAKFNLDIINTLAMENYEVKPELRQSVVSGLIQATIDNAALNAVRSRGLLAGEQPWRSDRNAVRGARYDWNNILFHLGTSYPDRVFIREGPNYKLWAGHKAPGVIVYWHEPSDVQLERDKLMRPVGYIPREAEDGDRPKPRQRPPQKSQPLPLPYDPDNIALPGVPMPPPLPIMPMPIF